MAMSQDKQQKLAQELANMNFNRASGRLRRLYPNNRLVFYRNSQSPTTLHTRYDLPGEGIGVTLVETMTEKAGQRAGTFKPEWALTQVIIDSLEQ